MGRCISLSSFSGVGFDLGGMKYQYEILETRIDINQLAEANEEKGKKGEIEL